MWLANLSATCNNNTSTAVRSLTFEIVILKSRTKSARSIEKSYVVICFIRLCLEQLAAENYFWKRCTCSIVLPSRFFFLFISFRRRSRECRSLDFLPKEIRRLATQEKRMRYSRRILSSRTSECSATWFLIPPKK